MLKVKSMNSISQQVRTSPKFPSQRTSGPFHMERCATLHDSFKVNISQLKIMNSIPQQVHSK